jgi:predicted phage-related endonuclease
MVYQIARSETPEWHEARRRGVSATSVARAAASQLAFDTEVEQLAHPVEISDNEYMRFGRDWENWIIDNLPKEHNITHNDWLIAKDDKQNAWQLATPDGNNPDWSAIAEVKTTGKDWDGKTIPIQYRRQVQWQLHVTGAEYCVFGWLLRVDTTDHGFQPGWYEPKHAIIGRDNEMISQLIDVAERLQIATIYTEKWEREDGTF